MYIIEFPFCLPQREPTLWYFFAMILHYLHTILFLNLDFGCLFAYGSIVAEQHYTSYRCTVQWFTIFKGYTPSIVIIKYCLYSLCCTIYPHNISVFYITVCTFEFTSLPCPSYLCSPHWQPLVCSLNLWACFFCYVPVGHLNVLFGKCLFRSSDHFLMVKGWPLYARQKAEKA